MLLWILIAAGAVAVDFLTKRIVMANMELYESRDAIPGFIELLYTKNDGCGWGMLSQHRWIFIALSLIAIVILPYAIYKYGKAHALAGASLSLLLGGAVGNMIDRTFYGEKLFDGAVVDFLHFQMKRFPILNEGFPIFNVADICVTVGAMLMIVYLIFFDGELIKRDKKDITEETEDDKN